MEKERLVQLCQLCAASFTVGAVHNCRLQDLDDALNMFIALPFDGSQLLAYAWRVRVRGALLREMVKAGHPGAVQRLHLLEELIALSRLVCQLVKGME